MPGLAEEARLRSFFGDDTYAISGVTHTFASRTVVEAVSLFAIAPVQAVGSRSAPRRPSIRRSSSDLLANAEEQLRARLGADLHPAADADHPARHRCASVRRIEPARIHWRTKLGIDEDATVVLFFGRLSVHAKASPFQLAQALEIAAQKSAELEIVWCGWFADDFQQKCFMTTAKAMAPSVRFHHLDGRESDVRFSIWSAADVSARCPTTSRRASASPSSKRWRPSCR